MPSPQSTIELYLLPLWVPLLWHLLSAVTCSRVAFVYVTCFSCPIILKFLEEVTGVWYVPFLTLSHDSLFMFEGTQ